jgi:ubiquinone/menaquinone biosynthesis C-methylase UbiE
MNNIDPKTVKGFGEEWNKFNQSEAAEEELLGIFQSYFKIFPWSKINTSSVGFDLGCGSGRWAKYLAPQVGKLHCIDASEKALEVAKMNLANSKNCEFYEASVDDIPLDDDSMDFGYSLGVLHHIPDTASGIVSCVKKLKPSAPFLLYIYYAFDNKPVWFTVIWMLSNPFRIAISRFPFRLKSLSCLIIALLLYYPLARLSRVLEGMGFNVDSFPLATYRKRSFYTMKTDALDRFGTRLERRFTAKEIRKMMEEAGLEKIIFSDSRPYWLALGYKKT